MLQNGPECFKHASKFQNRSPWNPSFFSHSVSLCNIMYHSHSIHSHHLSFPFHPFPLCIIPILSLPFHPFPLCLIPILYIFTPIMEHSHSYLLWNIPMISFPFHPFPFPIIPILYIIIPILYHSHSIIIIMKHSHDIIPIPSIPILYHSHSIHSHYERFSFWWVNVYHF